jgi:hypothetical protein
LKLGNRNEASQLTRKYVRNGAQLSFILQKLFSHTDINNCLNTLNLFGITARKEAEVRTERFPMS